MSQPALLSRPTRLNRSARHCATIYGVDGRPMVTACSAGPTPACAYCDTESTRTCDAEGAGRWGRCGLRMCEAHTTRVGEHHDLCREHAAGDQTDAIRRGETSHHGWWGGIQTKAVPIPGTARRPSEMDRIPGVIDPDDER